MPGRGGEGLGGQPGITHGFLQQGSQRVPPLMRAKGGDAKPASELAADVLGTGHREAGGGGVFAGVVGSR
jgi:hypothetical protein